LREDSFVLSKDIGGLAGIGRERFGTHVFRGLGLIFSRSLMRLRTLRGCISSSSILSVVTASLMAASWSLSSKMEKLDGSPAAAASRRSRRAQSE